MNVKPEVDFVWGSPLKQAANEFVTRVAAGGKKLVSNVLVSKDTPTTKTVEEAIAKLKLIAEVMEKDIAYYRLFEHQSMAINRLSFFKKDVLDTVSDLEKVCPSK